MCAAGDEPAWGEFLERFGPTVRRAVQKVFGRRSCPSVIEDSTQDISYALLAGDGRRLRAFRGGTDYQASGFLARTCERRVQVFTHPDCLDHDAPGGYPHS